MPCRCPSLDVSSSALARLQPLRQQRVGIEVRARIELDAALGQQLACGAAAPRVEQVGRAADVRAADEDLRDRARARARGEHGANLAAEVVFLKRDGIEIDAQEWDAKPREQLAHGPAELAPLEREQDDGLVAHD